MARIIFTLEDGTEIETELDSDTLTIGRRPDNTVVLPSASVSGEHATIRRRGEGYFVQDLGTTNGTKLNGVDVEEARLEHGDRLFFGDVPAVVQLVDKSAKPEPAKNMPPKPAAPNLKQTGPAPAYKPPGGAARQMGPRRGYNPHADQEESSGCVGFLGLLVFLLIAFVAGLCLRHAKEHGGFLITDIVKKYTEKGAHETPVAPPATPEKAAEPTKP